MRLADVILRRGHLSEDGLVEVWSTGVRPMHLERCDLCAERAVEISRWLEDVQAVGRADAEAVFTEERLAAQRRQVMQRLEYLDRPTKVISFPSRSARLVESGDGKRVNRGWLAAAAAAGLALGMVSVELSHTFRQAQQPIQVADAAVTPQTSGLASVIDASMIYDDPYSRTQLGSLNAMDEMTPRLTDRGASNR